MITKNEYLQNKKNIIKEMKAQKHDCKRLVEEYQSLKKELKGMRKDKFTTWYCTKLNELEIDYKMKAGYMRG